MLAGLLLAAALGSGSLVLPASPEGIGIGDIDGDSKNELVLLLVWPSWSSVAVSSSPSPGLYEIDVKPAIEDRRELWAVRVEPGRIERIAPPLRVGREVVAIGPLEPAGPVVVLEDEGVSRVVLDRAAAGGPVLKLERVAALRPLVAGLAAPIGSLPLLARLGREGPPRISVAVEHGITFLDERGGRLDVDSPFREVKSGYWGSVGVPTPRRIDLDRDGRFDLLWIDWNRFRAALSRALPDGSYALPVVWDLRPLVQPDPSAAEKPALGDKTDRQLVDVLDSDGDGTLEAVVCFQQTESTGMKETMKVWRGVPGEYRFFPLADDGSVAAAPSGSLKMDGHAADFDHPEGWATPFRDLDGDGRPELVTITVKVSVLGIAKAAMTKKMKMGTNFHVYRREEGGWREVADAAPSFEFLTDLEGLDASRFVRMPGDLDGDGRAEMVQVAGRDVEIHGGLPGGRFSDRPTRVVHFQDKIRDFFGLLFVDLDGDGRRELIGFEEQPREEDQPARSVRMELRTLEDEK